MAARALRGAGYDTLEAAEPQDALELAADRGRPMDVLITDIVMPGMHGHELSERIAVERPGIPVVFLSGSRERVPAGTATACGPSEFLLKPFEIGALVDATARVLAVAQPAADEPPPASAAPQRRFTDGTARRARRPAPESSRAWLPRGRTLPLGEWQRRHRFVVWILWAHALVLMTVGLAGSMSLHGLAHGAVVIPFALLASRAGSGRTTRELAATFGMLTSSAVVVHMSGGAIEGHFHYFTTLVLLSYYEDWLAFVVAIVYVLVQHSAMGLIDGSDVFEHGRDPWASSVIHAAAVALTAAATTLAWRLNEDVRRAEARVRDRLAHRALHDELTGLPNRRLLIKELERETPDAQTGNPGAAVIFVDVDHFKVINDSFGHSVGDRLLIDLADRLRSAVRAEDLVARSGGDEFVVLARPARSDADALAVAARIVDAMKTPFEVAGASRTVTVSMGVSLLGVDCLAPGDALGRADAAMYRAKSAGRGRLQLADDEVLRDVRRRLAIETALNDSTIDQFELHYQPIVDLADGSVPAVEALLRWRHPSLGAVSPGEFIPVAEVSGRILALDRWALELACRQAVAWEAQAGRPIRVYVNVSGNVLTHPGFAQIVEETMQATGADGRHIALELTETALAAEAIPADTLTALRRRGIDLILDDFGTGFSSLSYLSQFPISTIKLDRSFIARSADDSANCVILDVVTHLARGLGLPALAEGVETAEQLALIRAHGYSLAQGYLFARPQPAEEAAELVIGARPFAGLLDTAAPAAAGQAR